MKYILTLCISLFSMAVVAAEEQPQAELKAITAVPVQQKPGIVIIDGKKFFPLNNARHFTNSSPSSINIIHPQSASRGPIVTRGTKSSLPMTTSSAKPSAKPAAPGDILSVFAPEDKTAPTITSSGTAIK